MPTTLIKDLVERRQKIWHEAKALLDSVEAENRDLSAPEQERYDAMSGDLTSLRARIDRMQETEAQRADIEESMRKAGVAPAGQPDVDDLAGAFRALAAGERRSVDLSAIDLGKAVDKRALTKGTATAGGNTVPTTFNDQLIEHLVEATGLLQLNPTILTTTSGQNIEIPATTSYGSAAIVPENGTLAGTDPAFAKRTLGAYRYGQLVLVSSDLVSDSAFDLANFIARVAGRNVGLAFGGHLVTGTGTSQPTGVITTATTGVTGGAGVAGAFTADNLIDLQFSVTAPYRNSPSAGWLMKDASLGTARKLKDGAGRYLFEPGILAGAPDMILGKPVATDPNVAAVGLAAKSVAFGDFSSYYVRLAGGVRFERSDEFKFDTDQVAFRCLLRGDGLLADQTGAVKLFVGNGA